MVAEVVAGLEVTDLGGRGCLQQGEVEEEEEVLEEKDSPGAKALESFQLGQCCWAQGKRSLLQ